MIRFFGKPKLNRYGWKPDLPDHRDKLYHGAHLTLLPLPRSVDLRSQCPPVVDQGTLGSCTANALAGAIGFLDIKNQIQFYPFSRLFIYYNERAIEDTIRQDSGAQIRDGIKTLNKQGVCLEVNWPYDINKFTKKPSDKCYMSAKYHEAVTYQRIEAFNDMKKCLASGFPFVFGFSVYDSFESDRVAHTGIVPMPDPNEHVLGGHAVMAVGYDDSKQVMIVRNSWGTVWGMKGYFTLPYNYIGNNNLADDMWFISKTKSE
jgi:C1A family cysteine protease